MGTKVSLVAGVAALFVALVLAVPRPARRAVLGPWLVVLGVVGGFWYWRNLVVVGNPGPAVGALGLPKIQADPALQTPATGFDSTLAHLVGEDGARQTITGGLRTDLGPAWWAVVAVATFGLLAASFDRQRRAVVRALGVTGLVIGAVSVVTPQSGDSFPVNVRHAIPALALGLILLPIAVARRAVAVSSSWPCCSSARSSPTTSAPEASLSRGGECSRRRRCSSRSRPAAAPGRRPPRWWRSPSWRAATSSSAPTSTNATRIPSAA